MLKTLAMLSCTMWLAGCMSSNVLLTVRPDGSGTLEHTMQVRPSAMAAVEKLLSPGAVPAPTTRGRQPAWGEPLPQFAEGEWGRGVRQRRTRSLKSGDTVGWVTTYDFDNVATLDVDLLPRMGIQGFLSLAEPYRGATTRLRMALEPVAPGIERLTVRFPRFALDPLAEPPAAWASGPADEMAALQSAMKDARITVAVQTETPLLRTNSPHRDDNRVTLFDIDVPQALFGKAIAMLAVTPASFDELLQALGDLPGVTVARDHDVTLDFQNPATQTPAPVAAPPRAGAPAPDTEIFLAPLSSANGTLTVGTPANITNSPGYDNQPAFTPDGRSILFSSVRGVATTSPAIPATDIYRYDIASKQVARVTSTPEGEFSPTVMPDGGHISVIRVEADGTQRLWSFTTDGKSPALVLTDVKPVGYHAWIDDHTLALFILGDRGQPATLQVADTTTGKAEVITRDIGTSIKRMPSGAISFVQREPRTEGAPRAAAIAAQEAGVVAIKQLNVKGAERAVSALVRPVPGATQPDLAWMPDGTLLMAYGGTLYRWRAGDTDWTAVANLDALGLRVVTRLAVSPGGDRIAIVGQSR